MIEKYTLIQWLAFFFIYCFFGWCIESTIVSFLKKKLVNRGFLHGPFLPLYGFGAIVVLLSTISIENNIVLVYIFGLFSATCLEYLTGAVMEALLQIKYWDYSDKRFNINGYICLSSSLFWGVLSVLLLEVIHKPMAKVVTNIDDSKLTILIFSLLCIAIIDFIDSLRKTFSLQKLLDYETHIKEEISEITLKIASLKLNVTTEEGVRSLESYIEKLKEEIETVKDKAISLKTTVLKSFPSATSKRFNDALQDLKSKFK